MTHRAPRTALLHAELAHQDGAIQRTIGINDALPLAEVAGILRTCFNFRSNSPWSFRRGSRIIDPRDCLHMYPQLRFHWGLWDIDLDTLETYPRDNGTPQALCVAGSGHITAAGRGTDAMGPSGIGAIGEEFNPSAVNAILTGKATTEAILKRAHPEVASIIERSRIRDFVSLLQALDLSANKSGQTGGGPDVTGSGAGGLGGSLGGSLGAGKQLPLEQDAAGRDAFWSLVLALSCLSGPQLTDHIAETTMEALGWVDDDNSRLTADAIRALCASSLRELQKIVGNSVIERLDCYRDILRAPEYPGDKEQQ